MGLFLLAAALLLAPTNATAGQGTIEFQYNSAVGHDVGVLHLYLEPKDKLDPLAGEVVALNIGMTNASKILWDATDGHFRI